MTLEDTLKELEYKMSQPKRIYEQLFAPEIRFREAMSDHEERLKQAFDRTMNPAYAFESDTLNWQNAILETLDPSLNLKEAMTNFSYDCLDKLTQSASRISSCIVPAMDLPHSFKSLVQNPRTFTKQIQNIAALENTQYKNECVEVSEEDLDAIATAVGPEAVKDILNESDAQSSKQGKTTYKITVTKCIDLLKKSLIVVLSSLFLSAPAVSLIPNAEPISNFVNTVLSFTAPVQFFASLNEPNRLKK